MEGLTGRHGAVTLSDNASNTTACIAKDVAFTRMYGSAAAGGRFPLTTISLFGLRDRSTIALRSRCPKRWPQALFQPAWSGLPSRGGCAQLVSPVGMQLVCALHLLALNYYNMPTATASERAKQLHGQRRRLLAFAIRIAPAFGIGCVVTTASTSHGHKAVKSWYSDGLS